MKRLLRVTVFATLSVSLGFAQAAPGPSLPATMGSGSAGESGSPQSDVPGDRWRPFDAARAPSAREGHTAVWTGSEMIIWGGGIAGMNTGMRYNPVTDT